MIIPLTRASAIDVCTDSDISLSHPAAKYLAARTLAPRDIPIKRLVKILIRAVVDPTAARAWLLSNRPTTMISTALNISCRMLESISGSEKEISLSMMEPLHISISYLLCFTFSPPQRSFAMDILALSYLFVNRYPGDSLCIIPAFRKPSPVRPSDPPLSLSR